MNFIIFEFAVAYATANSAKLQIYKRDSSHTLHCTFRLRTANCALYKVHKSLPYTRIIILAYKTGHVC